mgnify:CR=1 FL=1
MEHKHEYNVVSFAIRKQEVSQVRSLEEILKILKGFRKKTNCLYTAVVDMNGLIVSSYPDEKNKKSLEYRTLVFYNELIMLTRTNDMLLNFRKKILNMTIYNEYDIQYSPNWLIVLIKSIINSVSLIAVFPSWLGDFIIPEFKSTLKRIRRCFKLRNGRVFLNIQPGPLDR